VFAILFPDDVIAEVSTLVDVKEFASCSERHKRRRTQSLMTLTTARLCFQKKLEKDGNLAGSKVL
jgi:hypothetical protein